MAIYRYGNSYAGTISGLGSIGDAVEKLTPKKRGRGRLGEAPDRDGLSESVARIYPGAGDPVSSIASPLTEDPDSAEYWTSTSSIESTDGLFVIAYNPVKTRVFTDANGETVVFSFPDPNAE